MEKQKEKPSAKKVVTPIETAALLEEIEIALKELFCSSLSRANNSLTMQFANGQRFRLVLKVA